MVIILRDNPAQKQIDSLVSWLKEKNLDVHIVKGAEQTIIGLIGDTSKIDMDSIKTMDIVEDVKRIQEPYKNVNRKFHPDDTVVTIAPGIKIGGGSFQVMAGPCSVEESSQVLSIAEAVKAAGASILRGGAFKPRTSPYAFQGLGPKGIEILENAKKETGMPIVSEIMPWSSFFIMKNPIKAVSGSGYPSIRSITAARTPSRLFPSEKARSRLDALWARRFSVRLRCRRTA